MTALPSIARAGTTVMNSLDDTATALYVTFSEPVSITSFGESFQQMTPAGQASQFTFYGGTIAPMGGFRLDWSPASAKLVSYEWLAAWSGSQASAAVPAASGSPETIRTDWSTLGQNVYSTSYNSQEAELHPPLNLTLTIPLGGGGDPNLAERLTVYEDVLLVSEGHREGAPNRVEAFNAATGVSLWSFELSSVSSGSMGSSPAVAEGVAFFGGQHDDSLYALDVRTGELIWERTGMGSLYARHPRLYRGRVYVLEKGGRFLSLDASTGARIWSADVGTGAGAPAIAWDMVLVGSATDLHALDLESGDLLWRRVGGSSLFNVVAIDAENGLIITQALRELDPPRSRVEALSPDGELVWAFEESSRFTGPLAVADGILYVPVWADGDGKGKLQALDTSTGRALWTYQLSEEGITPPAVANGVVYFSSRQGGLIALDAVTGSTIWTSDCLGWSPTQPVVANGALYVGWENTLCRFGPNQLPEAGFVEEYSEDEPGRISFDASASSDPDGTIVSYEWAFGDGESGTGETTSHSYSEEGTYTVTLTVRDEVGAESEVSEVVTISNHRPWAAFSYSPADPVEGPVSFDASASYDQDGTIERYEWDFGDGSTGTGETATHTYTEAGTYLPTLTVTDNDGADASKSQRVVVRHDNDAPTATYTWEAISEDGTRLLVEPRTGDGVRFDASTSSDSDGEIVEYAWDWDGDGIYDETSGDPLTEHWFEEAGDHTVTLQVTDDGGATGSETQTVTILAQQPPQAAFSFSPDAPYIGQTVAFDAGTSSDTDGEIATYAWDFDGDGDFEETTVLPTIEHAFTATGTHTVTLQVTDDDDATATHEELVTVAAAPTIIEAQQVWALVIGISDYSDVPDLRYARADAEAFTQWLLGAGVDPEHIRLLLDEETQLEALAGLRAEPATMVKVRAGLGWLRRMAAPDDLVFVFFAGHGYPGDDDDGDEADGVDEFLVLYDTLDWAKEETALRDDEFGQFLDKVESDHVMVVFDSCYAAGQSRSLSSGARPLGDEFDIFNDFSLDGKLILAAAREDQEALEHDGLGHGLFTHFLLQGLDGDADVDLDYRITAAELSAYVGEEVERFAREEMGRKQTPEMTGRGQVGIVLSRTNRPPEAAFTVAPDIPYVYGPTAFSDASTDDTAVVSWSWGFGDGKTSTEADSTHVYEQEGTYTVSLDVSDEGGEVATIEQEVVIAPPGEVTTVAGDTIIISLGSANGIGVGDRFEVVRLLELTSGTTIEERKATIEVIEVLDTDRAACEPIDAGAEITEGNNLRHCP